MEEVKNKASPGNKKGQGKSENQEPALDEDDENEDDLESMQMIDFDNFVGRHINEKKMVEISIERKSLGTKAHEVCLDLHT